MKNIGLVSITILYLIMTACHSKKVMEKSITAIAVKTQKVKYENFAEPIVTTGIITSSKEAKLSFKTGGIISSMLVEEGAFVQKGQLLATLNMIEVDAQVDQLRTSFEKAKRDYQRSTNLFLDSAISKEHWENAETALKVAEESFKIASFNKKFSSVYATETGIVIKKIANVGEITSPGSPVYVINSTSANDWIIRLGVSDRDWARLKLNDKAVVSLDAYPGQTFSGLVSKIEQATDLNSGTFAIEVKVHPGKLKFANGLIGKISIYPSQLQKLYLIPIEALHEADEKSGYIFSVDAKSNTASKHHVQIAYILKDKVGISSGLQNNSEVITQGVSYLSDNSPVTIQR